MHLIAWLIPLIPSILPLSTNTYGLMNNNLLGKDPCSIGQPRYGFSYYTGLIWNFTTFVGLGVICLSLITYFTLEVYYNCMEKFKTVSPNNQETVKREFEVYQSIKWYSYSIVICFTPMLVKKSISNLGVMIPMVIYINDNKHELIFIYY